MRKTIRFGRFHTAGVAHHDGGAIKKLIAAFCVMVATVIGFVAPGSTAYGEDGPQQKAAETAPVHTKHVVPNGDGTYTLGMDVKGSSTEKEQQNVKPVEIVLVLDVSGSMDWRFNITGLTRLQSLQRSVRWFLDQVAKENQTIRDSTKRLRVSLVKYAGDRKDRNGDDHYCIGEGKYPNCKWGSEYRSNYSQVVSPLTTDTDALSRQVDRLEPGGATRTDYGMRLAEKQLQGARGNARKVVILYSDGHPTSYRDFDNGIAEDALETAVSIKYANAEIFSIGTMPDADAESREKTNRFMNYISSNYRDVTKLSEGSFDRKRVSDDYYFAVKNDQELQSIFENIIGIIVTGRAYQDVKMTDTLSTYAEFTAPGEPNFGARFVVRDPQGNEVSTQSVGLPDGNGKTYAIASDPKSKTVSISFPEGYTLRDGYTYSLEYRIKPSGKAYEEYASNLNAGRNGYGEHPAVGDPGTGDSSAGKEGFLSNERAVLEYIPRVNGKPKLPPETREFPHPVIQVDGSRLTHMTIRKHWEGVADRPQSILVDVDCSAGRQACTSYKNLELKPGAGDANWQRDVVIPVIGFDRRYTVTEHDYDAYYTRYDDKRVWNLRAGESAPQGGYSTVITNYPRTAPIDLSGIRLGKTVAGVNLDARGKFDFTLQAAEGQNITTADGKPFVSAVSSLTGPFENGKQKTGAFNGRVSVHLPSPEEQEQRYAFTVSENDPGSGQWIWDRDKVDVAVTVTKNNGGVPSFNADNTVQTTVSYTYQPGDADGTASNRDLAAFTNKVEPVSKLPLTGENGATPSLWIGVGGGLGALALLIAGGAAALQRRRLI